MQAGMVGRTRHGLLTKYVDAYRASRALAGDYSPRTGRIVPKAAGIGKRSALRGCAANRARRGFHGWRYAPRPGVWPGTGESRPLPPGWCRGRDWLR